MLTFMVVVLFAAALFNFLAWPTFLRRVARDPRARDERGRPTKFLRVHVILTTIALVLAAGVAWVGVELLQITLI